MTTRLRKTLLAVLAAQFLASACGATQPWPQPQPQPERQWPLAQQTQPNFRAPSATHCARPVQTREVAGSPWAPSPTHPEWRGRMDKSEPAVAEAKKSAADSASIAASPATAAPASPGMAARAAPAELASSGRHAGAPFAPPQPVPAPWPSDVAPRQQPSAAPATVTAGMVDDNADFAGYLAFRNRTRVVHRARDIRERYLLEVKTPSGQAVADAEVAVQSADGAAMWARTDTAGRAWLHPNAFDTLRSPSYQVTARKQGRLGTARLVRGQKSAVEVVVDAPSAPNRARLDLVFLIDATGSMADEIDKLKASLRTIADQMGRLPSQPDLCFALVAYRDKGDQFLLRSHDFTNDLDGFQGALNALHAAGGGDYPEAMNEALHDTVHNLSWRGEGATRMVVLLADAPPHLDYGGPYYDDDMMAALGKGIKVFSVGASGLDKQGEYIQRQIAQYTGGRFVFLTYADARQPASGPGRDTVHDVRNYSVDTLDALIVNLVSTELAKLQPGR